MTIHSVTAYCRLNLALKEQFKPIGIDTDLSAAVAFFGKKSTLAFALGVNPCVVTAWKRRGLPGDVALKICDLTAGAVKPWQLKPALFPPLKPKEAD